MKKEVKKSQREMIEVLNKVNFPDGLSKIETFKILLWTIFSPKKLRHFVFLIEKGVYIKWAYLEAKKL